jgi:DNA-binding NarL/FixJ family response regulator
MSVVEAVRALLQAAPAVRVVVFASVPDDHEGLKLIREGAAGYLAKDMEPEALPRILRGVSYGEAAISRRLAMSLAEVYRRGPRVGTGLRPVRSPLTDREWEVLDLLATGARTDEIAQTLVLSTETVRSHLKNLYRKLGVRSRAEAVEAAERLRDPVI